LGDACIVQVGHASGESQPCLKARHTQGVRGVLGLLWNGGQRVPFQKKKLGGPGGGAGFGGRGSRCLPGRCPPGRCPRRKCPSRRCSASSESWWGVRWECLRAWVSPLHSSSVPSLYPAGQ